MHGGGDGGGAIEDAGAPPGLGLRRRAMGVHDVLQLLAFDMPLLEEVELQVLADELMRAPRAVKIARRQAAGLAEVARKASGTAAGSGDWPATTAAHRALWGLAGAWMRDLLRASLQDATAALEFYVEQTNDEQDERDENIGQVPDEMPQIDELAVADDEDEDDFVYESMELEAPPSAPPRGDDVEPPLLRLARDERAGSWPLVLSKLQDLLGVLFSRVIVDAHAVALLGGASATGISLATEIAVAACEHPHIPADGRVEIALRYVTLLQGCFSHEAAGAAALSAAVSVLSKARATLPAALADDLHIAVLTGLRRTEPPRAAKKVLLAAHKQVFETIASLTDAALVASSSGPAVFGLACSAVAACADDAVPVILGSGAARRILSIIFDDKVPHRSRLDALQGALSAAVSLPAVHDYFLQVPDFLSVMALLTREADMPQFAVWSLMASTSASTNRAAFFNAAAVAVRGLTKAAQDAVSGPREPTWHTSDDAKALVATARLLAWLAAWKRSSDRGAQLMAKQSVVRKDLEALRAALAAVPQPQADNRQRNDAAADTQADEESRREPRDPEERWRKSVANWAAGELQVLKALLSQESDTKLD